MNACELLLQNQPTWIDDAVVLVGHLEQYPEHSWDQVFWHDGQLVDVHGNPLAPGVHFTVTTFEFTPPTLREMVANSKPSTPYAMGYNAGYKFALAIAQTRARGLLESLGG